MSELRTCPACGFGVSETACPVCGWIEDFEQLVHPDFVVGANSGVSLREGQARAASLASLTHVRDPAWRPLRPGEHPAEGNAASPVCYLGTPERVGFVPYWLSP